MIGNTATLKCNILNGQVIYIEKSKLNIADMWLILIDPVTVTDFHQASLPRLRIWPPCNPMPTFCVATPIKVI